MKMDKLRSPSSPAESSCEDPFLFQRHHIIQRFKRLGNAQDLDKFRQTSQLYYIELSSTYFDTQGLRFHLISSGIQLQIETTAVTSALNPTKRYYPFPCWTPKVAQIFRELSLSRVSLHTTGRIPQFRPKKNITFELLIAQLRSNLTTLELSELVNIPELPTPGGKLYEFLTQFPNLKRLQIMYEGKSLRRWTPMDAQGVENLEFLLRSNHKIKVSLQESLYPDATLRKFGHLLQKFPNFELILRLTARMYFRLLRQLQLPFQLYSPNLKFRIEFKNRPIRSLHELESIASFCLEFSSQIQTLEINFGLDFHNLNENRVIDLRNCLEQLCPFVTQFELWYSEASGVEKEEWNIIGFDSPWPKLEKLKICCYGQPLTILKHCPNLESLALKWIDEKMSIFHQPQKTHDEALVEYFGNLSKLTDLMYHTPRNPCPIGKLEFQALFWKLLPKLKNLTFQTQHEEVEDQVQMIAEEPKVETSTITPLEPPKFVKIVKTVAILCLAAPFVWKTVKKYI